MNFLERIVTAFTARKIPYALVGGYAVALHGAPRGTVEIDIVVRHSEEFFKSVEQCMKDLGFVPRLPGKAKEIFHFKEEYIATRNLVAWSFYNPTNPLEALNVIITHDLSRMKSVSKKFGLGKINVLSIDDFIKLKMDAGRPQDLEDVKVLKGLRKKKKTPKMPVNDRPASREKKKAENNRPVQLASNSQILQHDVEDVSAIVEFLENFRQLTDPRAQHKSKLISIKIPEPLLAAFKYKADQEKTPYQKIIKQLMVAWLKSSPSTE